MTNFSTFLSHFMNIPRILSVCSALFLVIAGYFIAQFVSKHLGKLCQHKTSPQQVMLIKKFSHYFIFILFVIAALEQLGFSLSVLLSAAGVLTVAMSIASQTSISNIVSGLFLIGERPFVVGDIIMLDPLVGEVLSIDLLSVKLKKSDNTFIRIPNELLLKSTMINLTRYPLRRLELFLSIAYDSNLESVKKVLADTANNNLLALKDPIPKVTILNFGDSAINIQFSVWTEQKNFDDFKSSLQNDINTAFKINKIDMPYPQQTIHLER